MQNVRNKAIAQHQQAAAQDQDQPGMVSTTEPHSPTLNSEYACLTKMRKQNWTRPHYASLGTPIPVLAGFGILGSRRLVPVLYSGIFTVTCFFALGAFLEHGRKVWVEVPSKESELVGSASSQTE